MKLTKSLTSRPPLLWDRMEIARRMGYVPQRSEAGRMTAFDAILSAGGHISSGTSLTRTQDRRGGDPDAPPE